MMTPFSYPCMMAVLEQMDPSLRFKLARHIPSLRRMEKSARLRANLLVLDHNNLTINDTTYQLGLIRSYGKNNIPMPHERENNRGGLHYDLDLYGFRDFDEETLMSPGDILLEDGGKFDFADTQTEERMEQLEVYKNIYKGMYEAELERLRKKEEDEMKKSRKRKQSDYGRKAKMARFHVPDSSDSEGDEDDVQDHQAQGILFSLPKLKQYKEQLETMLLPFYCKKNQTRAVFETSIQLTTTCNDKETIQEYPFAKKLHEAIRCLHREMFGGRRKVIQVTNLHICSSTKILRIPEDMRIRCSRLRLFGGFFSRTIQELKGVLCQTSFPLDTLSTDVKNSEELLHPDIQSAKKLVVSNEFVKIKWVEALENLKNKRVHVKYDRIKRREFLEIFENFMTNELGTCHSFGIKSTLRCIHILETIKSEYPPSDYGRSWMTIPINETSEVLVTQKCLGDTKEAPDAIIMKIVPVNIQIEDVRVIRDDVKEEIIDMNHEDKRHSIYFF